MEKEKRTEHYLFQDLINKSIFSWLIFSTLGMVMVIYRSEITGWGWRESVQGVLCFGTLVLSLFRNKVNSKVKAGFLTGMLSVFALMGLFTLGFMAAAIHFIPLTGILLLLFFPSKFAEKYYLIIMVTMSFVALLFVMKWIELPFAAETLLTSWQHWLLVMLCFTFYIYFSTTALLVYKNETNSLLLQLTAKNKRLKEASFIDTMTGLPMLEKGGHLFDEHLIQWKENKEAVAVMYLDLDKFKVINEMYGHQSGDWCIKETAKRLEEFMGKHGFAMRIGGDEFLLVYHGFDLKMHAVSWAAEMLAVLQEPIALDHVNLKLNCSVGIAFYPDDGGTLGVLRRKADLAMYRSKTDEDLSITTYKSGSPLRDSSI